MAANDALSRELAFQWRFYSHHTYSGKARKKLLLFQYFWSCVRIRGDTQVCLQGMGGRRSREIVAKRYEASSLPCASSIENSFCPSAQCLGCSTIKVSLRGRKQSQYVFSHTSTKMCSYFYINICVSGARYYLYHKDKVSDRFVYFSVTLNAFVSHWVFGLEE